MGGWRRRAGCPEPAALYYFHDADGREDIPLLRCPVPAFDGPCVGGPTSQTAHRES